YHDMNAATTNDVIHVCTSTPHHHNMIIESIEKGKHILVEKPLTQDLNEALDIYKAVKEKKVHLSVIQNYRCYPVVSRIRQRRLSGYLGKIVSINGIGHSRFPTGWTRNTWLYHSEAVLYDFTPHLVDIMLWINNQPAKRVAAFGGDASQSGMKFMNSAHILVEFMDDSVVNIDTSWLTGSSIFQLEIHGTGGHVSLDVKNDIGYEIHGTVTPFDDIRSFVNRIKQTAIRVINKDFFKGPMGYFQPFLKQYFDFLNNKSGKLPVSIEEGLMTNAVLAAAALSIKEKRIIDIEEIIKPKSIIDDIKKFYS
ncbi:MAG: Gfo/Idh/MocA family oxidoreductase, partial [bacterium]